MEEFPWCDSIPPKAGYSVMELIKLFLLYMELILQLIITALLSVNIHSLLCARSCTMVGVMQMPAFLTVSHYFPKELTFNHLLLVNGHLLCIKHILCIFISTFLPHFSVLQSNFAVMMIFAFLQKLRQLALLRMN